MLHKRHICLTGLMLLLLPLLASAQEQGRITGKVTDAKTGEGLPGANVTIKGSYYGATSDIDGNVKIEKVNRGTYTLEVSLLGYKVIQFTNFKIEPGDYRDLPGEDGGDGPVARPGYRGGRAEAAV